MPRASPDESTGNLLVGKHLIAKNRHDTEHDLTVKNVALAVLMMVAGCTTGSHKVTGTLRPATFANQIVVYYQMPPHSKIIGRVSADSYGGVTLQNASDDALDQLKLEAGKLGANGIVLDNSNDQALGGAQVRGNAIFVSP
jgi:hypothetical protein